MTRPRRMRVCAYPPCGREFRHPEGKERTFCCPEHARLGQRRGHGIPLQERVCQADGCGAKFLPRYAAEKRRFCSRPCAMRTIRYVPPRHTHCGRRGDGPHPMVGDNVRIIIRDGRETRACRACERDRERARTGVRTPRVTPATPTPKRRPPAADAEVVRLLAAGGLSHAQIARRCGITTARVVAVAEREAAAVEAARQARETQTWRPAAWSTAS